MTSSSNFLLSNYETPNKLSINKELYDSVDDYVTNNSNEHTSTNKLDKLFTLGTYEKFLQNPNILSKLEHSYHSIKHGTSTTNCTPFFNELNKQVKENLTGIDIFKIVSWNVNGIRTNIISDGPAPNQKSKNPSFSISKNSNMHKLIDLYNPDILCLQETKCGKDVASAFIVPEYPYRYWSCTPAEGCAKGRGTGYAGVSIWSKIKAIRVQTELPGLKGTCKDGRVVIAEFPNFILINVYTPNSGTNELFRLQNWDIAMSKYLKLLNQQNKKIIFCGDMNIARGPNDIHSVPKQLTAGYLPLERQHFEEFLDNGMIDTFRELYGDVITDGYTWWNPKMKTLRENNKGWRIDYFLTSNNIYDKVLANNILKNIYGSDHCPIGLILCN